MSPLPLALLGGTCTWGVADDETRCAVFVRPDRRRRWSLAIPKSRNLEEVLVGCPRGQRYRFLGLEVAVDDALFCGWPRGPEQALRDITCMVLGEAETRSDGEPRGEALAVEELHG